MITKSIKTYILGFCVAFGFVATLTACSDMLETESDLVEYEKYNTLNHPTDSVYSVMGIINKMQIIADRTVLLGEVRADLVSCTNAANADLKRLANFDFDEDNKYCKISDYYAVINNCNYFIAHVDTALERRGRKLFTYEYNAVKTFRAWTYLELAKAYGSVPLVTTPVMTEQQATEAMNQAPVGIEEICDYFIRDLQSIKDSVTIPQYGNINGMDSKEFFIPMRALLGDLCLWAGRYREAAYWYHDYLNDKINPIRMNWNNRVQWTDISNFQRPRDSYNVKDEQERLSYIPMESRVFDGTISELYNIYQSNTENKYYFQLEPSKAMRDISAAQTYCMAYKNTTTTTTDTIYVPRTGFQDDIYIGDLRLSSNYDLTSLGQDEYSDYSMLIQDIKKFFRQTIITYRRTMVYLRYAEALNRAGLSQSAFAVLKYGICNEIVNERVDSVERVKAGDLIAFDPNEFTKETTNGIHSNGSGDADVDTTYVIPALATLQDSIEFVEDKIITEMALEGSFEGYRFYDLMRVALRRNNNAYLAEPVSRRNGDTDDRLRQLLMDRKNWYLPLR
jgi:hypothetical protein